MKSRRLRIVLAAAVLSSASMCDSLVPSDYQRFSSASGLLLGEGNTDAGRAAFMSLGCTACHTVENFTFELPESPLQMRVHLGGEVEALPTDGYLATAVINPQHELAKDYEREIVSEKGVSRMADYSDVITIRQLKDIVAFVHSRYRLPKAR